MTGIYNVVTKLRSMDVFTPAERIVHQAAAGRVLREIPGAGPPRRPCLRLALADEQAGNP